MSVLTDAGEFEPVGEADPLPAAATLLKSLAADDVNQDPPHQLSSNGEEMSAVLPADASGVDEPDVRLVDERGRLQRCSACSPRM